MDRYDNNANLGAEIGWEDEISQESGFELLEPGDYDFYVEKFERKRFPGSKKMCACNQAALTLLIDGQTVFDNLYLNKKAEWRISQFFIGIGQKQPGVPFVPNWNMVPGSRGRCKVGTRKWTGNDGNERTSNEVVEYYPYDLSNQASFPPAQTYQTAPYQEQYQASAQQQSMPGYAAQPARAQWQAGKF